ncbi:MAG TPA: hypothetical protein VFA47_00465 [Candidatus Manganitrophaceae bacterium]|nr:hypothetical protein [Candidatus Manganitrophaceae bacterium]
MLLFLGVTGCAATKPLPGLIYPKSIYPIASYPNSAESSGLKAAVYPFAPGRDIYANPKEPEKQNGSLSLNVLDAGVMPVRLIVLNDGDAEILFDPDQIRGISGEMIYRPYTAEEAVDLVARSSVFKEAIKGSQVGPVLKSLLGGEIMIEAFRGGVSGVASGGITGGANGVARGAVGIGMERAREYENRLIQILSHEYTKQQIKRQTLSPGFLADGLIFLPSQVGITQFYLPVVDLNTKKTILLKMEVR